MFVIERVKLNLNDLTLADTLRPKSRLEYKFVVTIFCISPEGIVFTSAEVI